MKLTSNEILAGNKLIAEFLTGYKLEERREQHYKKVANIPVSEMSREELDLFNNYPIDKYNSIGYTVNKNSLKFHSSWDWLMPVVEKIEKEYNYIFSSLYDPTLKEYDIFIDHQNKNFTDKNEFDNLGFEEHFNSKLESYYWAVLKIIKQINE